MYTPDAAWTDVAGSWCILTLSLEGRLSSWGSGKGHQLLALLLQACQSAPGELSLASCLWNTQAQPSLGSPRSLLAPSG